MNATLKKEVSDTIINLLQDPVRCLNLRATFDFIANLPKFKGKITPKAVSNLWYNHVSKRVNCDTTNKVGEHLYCFMLVSKDNRITVPNRKNLKSGVKYLTICSDDKVEEA